MAGTKVNMKFYVTSLTPIEISRVTSILFRLWIFTTLLTVSVGVTDKEQDEVLTQLHPDYILQVDEHPSPFRVFPSSQRSEITIPSPHISTQVPDPDIL